MMRTFFAIAFSCYSLAAYSQTRSPQTPQASTPHAVYGTNRKPDHSSQQYRQPHQVQMGATANDVAGKGQQQSINTALGQKRQEVDELLKEVQHYKLKYEAIEQNRALAGTSHIRPFNDALKRLQDMLSGRLPLSVADAYFTTENAFGNNYLTHQEYNSIIRESAAFIKIWMQQNGVNEKDPDKVHQAIQKFMSEPLTITKTMNGGDKGVSLEPITHTPFHYDYNDYRCEKDYRNMFLTKCLATGFGQCASMPAVYLVLAEALGVQAYLTFVPQHTFIKYKDSKGNIRNYEPTSNWEITDKWYKDEMFISSQAVTTGIYLDTFNSRQVVAQCIFDLATEYIILDRTGHDDLINDCLKVGSAYFPKNNNLTSLFIKSIMLKTQLREAMRKHNITSFDELEKIPEVRKLYNEYMGNEAYITKLGYQDIPAGKYEAMLEQHEFKGKVQQHYNVSGKEKHNLFSTISQ